jgi:hypothetical protein
MCTCVAHSQNAPVRVHVLVPSFTSSVHIQNLARQGIFETSVMLQPRRCGARPIMTTFEASIHCRAAVHVLIECLARQCVFADACCSCLRGHASHQPSKQHLRRVYTVNKTRIKCHLEQIGVILPEVRSRFGLVDMYLCCVFVYVCTYYLNIFATVSAPKVCACMCICIHTHTCSYVTTVGLPPNLYMHT